MLGLSQMRKNIFSGTKNASCISPISFLSASTFFVITQLGQFGRTSPPKIFFL